MPQPSTRPRWVAIVTGAISIAIGLVYLLMITVLDARGPMRPPPPEALAEAVSGGSASVGEALQPAASPSPGIVLMRHPVGSDQIVPVGRLAYRHLPSLDHVRNSG